MKTKETIEQKRIEILKDVLKHIEAKRIVANTGSVLRYGWDASLEAGDLQTILKAQSKKKVICQVCQRGALLFAAVWKNNNCSVDKWQYENSLKGLAGEDDAPHLEYLNALFSIEQQKLMERAFEGDYHSYALTSEQADRCINKYYTKYKDPLTRMKNIVKNAIKNGGVFKP